MMSRSTEQQIRSHKIAVRRNLNDDEWAVRSAKIKECLFASEVYRNCGRLFAFMSLAREPDTKEIITEALCTGKEVAIPKCRKNQTLGFYLIDSISDVTEGLYGINEPFRCDADHEACPENGDLILIPGLAFDRSGNRIGYGKGYYDRYLSSLENETVKVMLAFSFQEEPSIEPKETDIPVDMIMTDEGLITIRK